MALRQPQPFASRRRNLHREQPTQFPDHRHPRKKDDVREEDDCPPTRRQPGHYRAHTIESSHPSSSFSPASEDWSSCPFSHPNLFKAKESCHHPQRQQRRTRAQQRKLRQRWQFPANSRRPRSGNAAEVFIFTSSSSAQTDRRQPLLVGRKTAIWLGRQRISCRSPKRLRPSTSKHSRLPTGLRKLPDFAPRAAVAHQRSATQRSTEALGDDARGPGLGG